MRKTVLFLLLQFCLACLSYGQKIGNELRVMMHNAAPDEKIPVVVYMTTQSDVIDFEGRTTYLDLAERQQFVKNELQRLSSSSQNLILRDMHQMELAGSVANLKSYWVFNGFSCMATSEVINSISLYPEVLSIFPDSEGYAFADDVMSTEYVPVRGNAWHVDKLHAPDAWNYGATGYTGNGVIVAIIDSGVNYNHTDIQNNIWPGRGYNFVTNTSNPKDDYGHGTICAGIVAGYGTNGTQTGIAKNARIMALKVVNRNGETSVSLVLQAIEFAIDHGARIINIPLSLSYNGAEESLRTALENALEAGVIASVAAGDAGSELSAHPVPNNISVPGNCPPPYIHPNQTLVGGRSAVVSVGASDMQDSKPYFSSVGPSSWTDYQYSNGSATQIGLIRPDFLAPGFNLTSLKYDYNDAYETASGTGVASACAAGVMALLLEANPELTPCAIDSLLEISAVSVNGLFEKNNYTGSGRIDAKAALDALLSPFDAPSNVSATLENSYDVRLTWSTVASVSGYDVYRDGECIASDVAVNEYLDSNVSVGRHLYYLKSKQNGLESVHSEVVSVEVLYQSLPPTDIISQIQNHNVILSWTAPQSGIQEMKYGSGAPVEYFSKKYWAQRYPASMLSQYAGMSVTKISFYANVTKSHEVSIYKGDANGISVCLYTNTITPNSTGWQEVTLDAPVTIDYLNDMWIRCYVSNPGNDNTVATCMFPGGVDASFMSDDGSTWEGRSNTSVLIKAEVTDGIHTYNIFRGEDENGPFSQIASEIEGLSYIDLNLPNGVYYYYLTTNCLTGASNLPSEIHRAVVGLKFVVSLNVGSGSCSVQSLTETSTGSGVVLPEAQPSGACAYEGFAFAGWCDQLVSGISQRPEILEAGSVFYPENNCTLYAVYSRIESGTTGYRAVDTIAFGDVVYLVSEEKSWELSGFANNHGTPATFVDTIACLYPFQVLEGYVEGTYAFKHADVYLSCGGAGKLSENANMNDSKSAWYVSFDADKNAFLENASSAHRQIWANNSSNYFACADNKTHNGTYKWVQLYKYVDDVEAYYISNPVCIAPVVETPVIVPSISGPVIEPQQVSITCETEGASIFYTLDGTEPTQSSIPYTGSFTVSETTTVNVRAYFPNYEPSMMASQSYVFPVEYENIAEFKAAYSETCSEYALISGDVTVVHHDSPYLYIQDNTAALMVLDNSELIAQEYQNGDVISGGLIGCYSEENGQPALMLLMELAAATSGDAVEPIEVGAEALVSDYAAYDARLVRLNFVGFEDDFEFGPTNLQTAFVQGETTVFANSLFGNITVCTYAGESADVVGFVGRQGDDFLLNLRDDADVMPHDTVSYQVCFVSGTGSCSVPYLVESSPESGVVLPEAVPSIACTVNGYVHYGWSREPVSATSEVPDAYAAGSVYHPEANDTLYAVYHYASEWLAVTGTEDIVEDDYILASNNSNNWYYMKHTGNDTDGEIKAGTMTVSSSNVPSKTEAPWHIAPSGNGYLISYSQDGQTYYLQGVDRIKGIQVVNASTGVWHFTDDPDLGLLASFGNDRVERFIVLHRQTASVGYWYNYPILDYEGRLVLLRNTDAVFDSNPECVAYVDEPVFDNIPGDVCYEVPFTVTISCPTPNSTIYYTTDGSEPDATSMVYTEGGFVIDTTCMVKAIAYAEGLEPSEVVSHSFVLPIMFDNIAAFKEAYSSTSSIISGISGDVQFVFRSGQYIYVKDETAGLLLTDAATPVITNSYQNGDTIRGGIFGTMAVSAGQKWMVPTFNPAQGIAGAAIEPESVSASSIITRYEQYDSKLVKISGIKYNSDFNYGEGGEVKFVQTGSSLYSKNQFGIEELLVMKNETYDITGFVSINNSGVMKRYVSPRDINDVVYYYHVVCDSPIVGGAVRADKDSAREGDNVTLTVTPSTGYDLVALTVTDTLGNLVEVVNNRFVMPAMDVLVSAEFTLHDYVISVVSVPEAGGIIEGAGEYHYGDTVTLVATPNDNYSFVNWTENDVVLSDSTVYSFRVFRDHAVFANFHSELDVQMQTLSEGWNWWSSYIEIDSVCGLSAFEEALGEDASTIKSQSAFVAYDGEAWVGTLDTISNSQGYMVQMNVDHELVMSGVFAQPENHPIELHQGWNWIGYPLPDTLSIEDALAVLVPLEGDVVKSQSAFTIYSDGSWIGTLNTMVPGTAYLFNFQSEEVDTLIYSRVSRTVRPMNVNKETNWRPDFHRYADNITIVAVSADGCQGEIAAFVDGECRGSVNTMRVGANGQQLAFLTVSGEDGDRIVFRRFEDGEYAEESIVFRANDIVGSVKNPFVLHFGNTGVEEIGSEPEVQLFPNPACDNLNVVCKGMRNISLVDVAGQVISCFDLDADSIQLNVSGLKAGIYMLTVRTETGLITKRISVVNQ